MLYKEIVLTIGYEAMQPSMCLTPGYLNPRLKQMTLAVGTDGVMRLYGYTSKEFTTDPKKPEPKKPDTQTPMRAARTGSFGLSAAAR